MKNLTKITGVKILSKKDQNKIHGNGWPLSCMMRGNKCCERWGGSMTCEEGECILNSFCHWYNLP